jgi:hypothetical protein
MWCDEAITSALDLRCRLTNILVCFYLPDSELLGSPLACPFSPGDYDDDTVLGSPRKQWQKDEENHGSLSVIKARYITVF